MCVGCCCCCVFFGGGRGEGINSFSIGTHCYKKRKEKEKKIEKKYPNIFVVYSPKKEEEKRAKCTRSVSILPVNTRL